MRKRAATVGGVDWPSPVAALRSALTRWYERNKRDLPWRRTGDPYAIWVSEVMLQQTQVETVKRYWSRFLARFPTPGALADAPLEDVLRAWSGLGFYRRARLMHQAARVIRDEHGHRFPRAPDAIRRLPGIGDYTAGALLSIAFGTPAAAVDGNVRRVLSRLLCIEGDGRAEQERVAAAATELVEAAEPGSVVQGLMELGATVCTPANARCDACPWRADCRAHSLGLVEVIPPPRKRAARKPLQVALGLVVERAQVSLVTRAAEGLFGGLWELPSSEAVARRGPAAATMKRALEVARPELAVGKLLARTERTLTHKDLVLWTFAARFKRGSPDGVRQVRLEDLRDAPLSSAMRAALDDALGAREAME